MSGGWEMLKKSNAGKLSENLAREKHADKQKLKDAITGNAEKGIAPAPTKETLPPKKAVSKADIKAYHDALDATAATNTAKQTETQKMKAYKKVLGYYEKDKSCLRSKPSPNDALAQLAEIKARYASTGGEMMVQQFFTKATDVAEALLVSFNALEVLDLRKGFSSELTRMLATDPAFYEPELTELRLETGRFEAEWQYRLAAKWFGHWKAWSGSQVVQKDV